MRMLIKSLFIVGLASTVSAVFNIQGSLGLNNNETMDATDIKNAGKSLLSSLSDKANAAATNIKTAMAGLGQKTSDLNQKILSDPPFIKAGLSSIPEANFSIAQANSIIPQNNFTSFPPKLPQYNLTFPHLNFTSLPSKTNIPDFSNFINKTKAFFNKTIPNINDKINQLKGFHDRLHNGDNIKLRYQNATNFFGNITKKCRDQFFLIHANATTVNSTTLQSQIDAWAVNCNMTAQVDKMREAVSAVADEQKNLTLSVAEDVLTLAKNFVQHVEDHDNFTELIESLVKDSADKGPARIVFVKLLQVVRGASMPVFFEKLGLVMDSNNSTNSTTSLFNNFRTPKLPVSIDSIALPFKMNSMAGALEAGTLEISQPDEQPEALPPVIPEDFNEEEVTPKKNKNKNKKNKKNNNKNKTSIELFKIGI